MKQSNMVALTRALRKMVWPFDEAKPEPEPKPPEGGVVAPNRRQRRYRGKQRCQRGPGGRVPGAARFGFRALPGSAA